jgi:hypothetical protein
LPPLRPIEAAAAYDWPTGTLSDQGQLILQATAAGRIAPGQAAQLLGAIAAQAKIVEVDELARRLSALETRFGGGNGKF